MRRTAKPSAKPTPRPPKPPVETKRPAPPPEPAVDVRACFGHLLAALDALARTGGSPPEVMHELDALRAALGKEA